MPGDWAIDIGVAPEGARSRLAEGINRPRKRAFGVFKTEDEFIGAVRDDGFEIWERSQRAVHAIGTFRARRGGTRIEMRFALPTRTRVLIAVFFVLYVLVALGIAIRPPDSALNTEKVLTAAVGGLVVGAIFLAGARSQRAALRAFVEKRFRDVPRL